MNKETRQYIEPNAIAVMDAINSLTSRISRRPIDEWTASDFAMAASAGDIIKYHGDKITTILETIRDRP